MKEDEIMMDTVIDRRKEERETRKEGSMRRKEGRKMKDSEIER